MQSNTLTLGHHYSSEPQVRIANAKREIKQLLDLAAAWSQANPITPQTRLASDERTVEVYARHAKVPTARWTQHAANAFQALRESLEILNFELSTSLKLKDFKERSISYPITDSEQSWSSWLGQNGHLPTFIIDRYRALQPVVSGDRSLSMLRDWNNSRKHQLGIKLGPQLGSLSIGGELRVEGLLSDSQLTGTVDSALLDPILEGGSVSTRVLAVTYPARILDFDSSPQTVTLAFEPSIAYSDDSIEIRHLPALATTVQAAIDYIVGRRDSGVPFIS